LSETEKRKIEHIDIAITKEIRGPLTTWLEHVHLIHDAVPEIDFNEIDLSIEFLGKKLKAPIIISGMTGGHKDTAKINEALAEAAEKFGIAIGVGSQRAAIENPELEYTYSIVRERAPSTVVLANIGAAQIVKGYDVDKILKAIDMLKADGIAIHLNPAQESVQPEGEPFYKGFLRRLRDIAESINKPIIIKETGTGLSRESVAKLRDIGI
jgi:isopentenyl-diphosphate delta-isomerase